MAPPALRKWHGLMVAVFHVILLAVGALASQDDPQPTSWPPEFFSSLLRNGTGPDGTRTPYTQILKFYNWPTKQYLQECSVGGIASSFLLEGTNGWVFNKLNEACVNIQLPVSMVTPDWMQGGVYEGMEVINGVVSRKWNKADHLYYENVLEPRPTRVYTPLDNKGFQNQEDYGVFFETEHDPTIFDLPAFCDTAAAGVSNFNLNDVDFNFHVNHGLNLKQGLQGAGRSLRATGDDADPMGCFI